MRGVWVKTRERQPDQPGFYEVRFDGREFAVPVARYWDGYKWWRGTETELQLTMFGHSTHNEFDTWLDIKMTAVQAEPQHVPEAVHDEPQADYERFSTFPKRDVGPFAIILFGGTGG